MSLINECLLRLGSAGRIKAMLEPMYAYCHKWTLEQAARLKKAMQHNPRHRGGAKALPRPGGREI